MPEWVLTCTEMHVMIEEIQKRTQSFVNRYFHDHDIQEVL